jgi:hypothetical protein
MLRTFSSVIAVVAMVVALATAQAADTTLTLACQGTVSQNDAKPEPISMGVIVNFAARTVQGFGYQAEITSMDDVSITFARSGLNGTVDRVTGDLEATSVLSGNNKVILAMNYLLKCRPTQRMF